MASAGLQVFDMDAAQSASTFEQYDLEDSETCTETTDWWNATTPAPVPAAHSDMRCWRTQAGWLMTVVLVVAMAAVSMMLVWLWGCQLMSLNLTYIPNFTKNELDRKPLLQGVTLQKNCSQARHQDDAKYVLDMNCGLVASEKHIVISSVVPLDGLLRLAAMEQRVRYDFPVCSVGKTGCGQTEWVRLLSNASESLLLTMDIHGGITEIEIVGLMDLELAGASEIPEGAGGMTSFGEVTAVSCMGCMRLFKRLMIDPMLMARYIPTKVSNMSSCSPTCHRYGFDYDWRSVASPFMVKRCRNSRLGFSSKGRYEEQIAEYDEEHHLVSKERKARTNSKYA